MKGYNTYMDRQELSPAVHERLINLEVTRRPARPWVKYGALAACAALIVGVGAWRLAPNPSPVSGQPVSGGVSSAEDNPFRFGVDQAPADTQGFAADSGEDLEKMMLPDVPGVAYPDTTGFPQIAASIVLPSGSFSVELSQRDIELLLWGSEERLEQAHAKEKPGNVPWLLFWDGFTLSGQAVYDGQGNLWQVNLNGTRENERFELRMAPGQLPPTCVAQEGSQVTDVRGVAVEGWSSRYDSDGDGVKEYHCESAFIAHNVGVRAAFVSATDDGWLSDLFINWNTYRDGGLTLDHLLTNDNIPAWREEEFSTLDQARREADFAPYLPTAGPEGYGEFYGRLSYQEGRVNSLFVRWSRAGSYDDVEVAVYRDGGHPYKLADPDRPETYDERLYSIPWCDSVPEEYRETVDRPAFRAEDLSLSIVEARCHEKDTGGLTFSFEVLHPDGTLVSYRCDGMTAEGVWELVKGTLE